MNIDKKKYIESLKRLHKVSGSKEETWNEAYGDVNMPWFVQDTLETEFNNLWENA